MNFSGYFLFFLEAVIFITIISTFTKVVKFDVENGNVVSTLSNVVHVNVDSNLLDVVNFNVEIHNVVSTLI